MILVEIYYAKNIAEVSFKLVSLQLEIHCSSVYLDLSINDQLKKSVRKTKTIEKIRVDPDVTSVF